MITNDTPNASQSGTFKIGGEFEINRLGYGAMRITGSGIWGQPDNRNEAIRVLSRLPELGVNFIDTADSYGPDVSEELIAESLHPYPDGTLIATKGGLTRPGPNQWKPNGDPGYLRSMLEGSLRRLNLDRIDLYQLHRIDDKIPMKVSLGALRKAQQEGLIRFIGLSEVSAEQLDEASDLIEIATVQNMYNIAERRWESTLEWCEARNVGFIPWYPLSAGSMGDQEVLTNIAEKHQSTEYQVALAWLLQRSPVMLPIPGTSSVAHLEENVSAAKLTLDEDDMSKINKLGKKQGK